MQFKKGKIGRDGSSRLKGNCNLCSQSYFTISYGKDNIISNNLIPIVKLLIYKYKMNDEDPSFSVILVKRQAHLIAKINYDKQTQVRASYPNLLQITLAVSL